MKKVIGIVAAFAVILAIGTSIFAAKNSAPKPLKAVMGHWAAPGDYISVGADMFAELVKEKTNGGLVIDVYPGDSLSSTRETIEAVDLGTIQFVLADPPRFGLYHKVASVFSVPYLIANEKHAQALWDGEIGQEIMRKVEGVSNLRFISAMAARTPRSTTANKPIRTLADWKGVKIRIPEWGGGVEAFSTLGCTPVTLPFSEVFTGLQTGMLDAQENPISLTESFGLQKVQRYLMLDEHLWGQDGLLMTNQQWWNKLPKNYQTAIKEAAEEVKKWTREKMMEADNVALKKLKADGMTVIPREEIDIEGFKKAVFSQLHNKAPFNDPEVKAMIEKIKNMKY